MSEEKQSEAREMHIGFLDYLDLESGAAYRGAILITDSWGKPLEFRCTAPVRPNPVQRTLYGQRLLPHMAVELFGVPLLRNVQEKPGIVLVQNEFFFDLRRHTEFPLVRIRQQGTQVKVSEDEKPSTSLLDSASGKFQPIIVEQHPEYPDDRQTCLETLRDLFQRWDIIEPFERLKKALEYVHEKKAMEG